MLSQRTTLLLFLICLSASSQTLGDHSPADPRFLSERVLADRISFQCRANTFCAVLSVEEIVYSILLRPKSVFVAVFDINEENRDITINYNPGSSSTMTTTSLYLDCLNRPSLQIDVNDPDGRSWSQVIPGESTKGCNGRLRFFIENDSTVYISRVTYQIEIENDYLLLKILVPILGFLLLVTAVCAFVQYRKRMRIRRELMRQRVAPGGVQSTARNEYLNEKNLDERFPAKPYEEFQSSFPQSTCSICLDELQKDGLCRQLYCEHIFHSECAALWLKNLLKKGNAFCPNCNKNMMRKDEIQAKQQPNNQQ